MGRRGSVGPGWLLWIATGLLRGISLLRRCEALGREAVARLRRRHAALREASGRALLLRRHAALGEATVGLLLLLQGHAALRGGIALLLGREAAGRVLLRRKAAGRVLLGRIAAVGLLLGRIATVGLLLGREAAGLLLGRVAVGLLLGRISVGLLLLGWEAAIGLLLLRREALLLRWHLLGSGHLWPAITKDHLDLQGGTGTALDGVERDPLLDGAGRGVLGDGEQVASEEVVVGEAVPVVDVDPDRVGAGVEAARVECEGLTPVGSEGLFDGLRLVGDTVDVQFNIRVGLARSVSNRQVSRL